MPKREVQEQEVLERENSKKRYRVLRADFPLVVQETTLTTGATVELEETDQIRALVEAKILKEV